MLSVSRGFRVVIVLSVSRDLGLSRCCPLLGVSVCHGDVCFKGFRSVTVLSASRV